MQNTRVRVKGRDGDGVEVGWAVGFEEGSHFSTPEWLMTLLTSTDLSGVP